MKTLLWLCAYRFYVRLIKVCIVSPIPLELLDRILDDDRPSGWLGSPEPGNSSIQYADLLICQKN